MGRNLEVSAQQSKLGGSKESIVETSLEGCKPNEGEV